MNLAQEKDGVNLVMLRDFKDNFKNWTSENKVMMNLYNTHNLMLYIIINVLNGYLLKNFKILLILQKAVLARFIQLSGQKDILNIGIIKSKYGKDINIVNLH
jgi:hypothetical protein